MHLRIITVVIIVGSLLGVSVDALACSCGENPPPKEALGVAVAVFSGEVIGIELPPLHWQGDTDPPSEDLLLRPSSGGEVARLQRVTISVAKVWKGQNIRQRQLVYSLFDCCMCGFGFEAGQQYLIYTYAGSDGKRLFTSICSRTAKLDSATADVEALPTPIRDFESSRLEESKKRDSLFHRSSGRSAIR